MVTTENRVEEARKLRRSSSGRLLGSAALIEAALFAAIGLRHIDREAIAFAALFAIGVILLRVGRRGYLGLALLAVLSIDTEYWMITALVSNLQNQSQALSILQPLVLVLASALVLVGVIESLWSHAVRDSLRPAALITAGGVFVLALAAEFLLSGSGAAAGQGLALRIQNASFSSRSLTVDSGQVAIDVTNQDLFWHTFTVEGLPVNVALPNGAQKRITFNAPPGTYTFYCAIPGHRQAGMVGTITLR
jgi:plastocyanin